MARPIALLWFPILLAASCATSRDASDSAGLRADCAANVRADDRCVEVLTRPSDGYEAKAEVQDAEARREAGAFQDRLARLRAAHEARQVRSSTTPVALPEALAARAAKAAPARGDDDDSSLDVILSELEQKDAPDTGSSVRAMTAAPEAPGGARVAPSPAPPASAPTPEAWMRGARCLLAADRAAFAKILDGLRSRARTRGTQGALALVMVDQDALMARIDAELRHRGLAKAGPLCASSALKASQVKLRVPLGPPPTSGADVARYGPGLERLEQTLQVRAGLPRAR